jgi:hypothetical protein
MRLEKDKEEFFLTERVTTKKMQRVKGKIIEQLFKSLYAPLFSTEKVFMQNIEELEERYAVEKESISAFVRNNLSMMDSCNIKGYSTSTLFHNEIVFDEGESNVFSVIDISSPSFSLLRMIKKIPFVKRIDISFYVGDNIDRALKENIIYDMSSLNKGDINTFMRDREKEYIDENILKRGVSREKLKELMISFDYTLEEYAMTHLNINIHLEESVGIHKKNIFSRLLEGEGVSGTFLKKLSETKVLCTNKDLMTIFL